MISHSIHAFYRHQSAKHRNVCHSTKYLMLHVRDCSGLLPNGDICPFPWCRKAKHLLYHLVSCEKASDGNQCSICSPMESKLSTNLVALVGLNTHRRIKFRERVKAVLAKRQQLAAAAAIARASSSGKDGNHMMNPPQQANTTRVPIARDTKFAPMNQVSQRHAHFSISQQQQVGSSLNQTFASQNPASSTFDAAQPSIIPTATASIAAATTFDFPPDQHLPSPALSATLTGLSSSLSVSALPSLEEAALELGDITLSTSDLIGLSSPSGNELSSAFNGALAEALPAPVTAMGSTENATS